MENHARRRVTPHRQLGVRRQRIRQVATVFLVAGGIVLSVAASAQNETVIATVGGEPVTRADVTRRVESLPLGDQVAVRASLRRFAESVVQEEMLFRFAMSDVVHGDAQFRDDIKSLVVAELIKRRVHDEAAVSDEDVERYYTENPSQVRGEHWRVRQIPLETHAECKRLMTQISDQESFARLASIHSLDADLRASGGDMGYFMLNHDVLGLGELIRSLPVGAPMVLDDQNGCRIIMVTEHLQPPVPPLEAISDRLRVFLEGRREAKLLRELVDEASQSVPVTLQLDELPR